MMMMMMMMLRMMPLAPGYLNYSGTSFQETAYGLRQVFPDDVGLRLVND